MKRISEELFNYDENIEYFGYEGYIIESGDYLHQFQIRESGGRGGVNTIKMFKKEGDVWVKIEYTDNREDFEHFLNKFYDVLYLPNRFDNITNDQTINYLKILEKFTNDTEKRLKIQQCLFEVV